MLEEGKPMTRLPVNARIHSLLLKMSPQRVSLGFRHSYVVKEGGDILKISLGNRHFRKIAQVLIVITAGGTTALRDSRHLAQLDQPNGSMQVSHVVSEAYRAHI